MALSPIRTKLYRLKSIVQCEIDKYLSLKLMKQVDKSAIKSLQVANLIIFFGQNIIL